MEAADCTSPVEEEQEELAHMVEELKEGQATRLGQGDLEELDY